MCMSLVMKSILFSLQVAEKIRNKKELEFYKWDGDLSQLLQNVRDKLNRVAEVTSPEAYFLLLLCFGYASIVSKLVIGGGLYDTSAI